MDGLLTAIAALTQLILGGMGIYVSLRPPKNPQRHRYWIGAFLVVGILGVVLTGWLAQRSSNAQDKATAKISEAVTQATNANTAATNANNAAVASEKETEAASAEARKANESLSKLINQRSHETNTAIVKLGTDTETSIKAISTGPPPRRIPAEKRDELIQYLAGRPAKVKISAIANDLEAYRFAQDWFEVLKAAKWTIDGDRIATFIISGQPQTGVVASMRGEPVGANEIFQVPNTEPAAYLANAMTALKVSFAGQRYPDIEAGTVGLAFYVRPPSQ
jgi:hypothetical protein